MAKKKNQVCWVWDRASPHRASGVREALRAQPNTFAVVGVPAGLTWLLQILDVYVFRRLKSNLPGIIWESVVRQGKSKMRYIRPRLFVSFLFFPVSGAPFHLSVALVGRRAVGAASVMKLLGAKGLGSKRCMPCEKRTPRA